jgi:hypothetical protein
MALGQVVADRHQQHGPALFVVDRRLGRVHPQHLAIGARQRFAGDDDRLVLVEDAGIGLDVLAGVFGAVVGAVDDVLEMLLRHAIGGAEGGIGPDQARARRLQQHHVGHGVQDLLEERLDLGLREFPQFLAQSLHGPAGQRKRLWGGADVHAGDVGGPAADAVRAAAGRYTACRVVHVMSGASGFAQVGPPRGFVTT